MKPRKNIKKEVRTREQKKKQPLSGGRKEKRPKAEDKSNSSLRNLHLQIHEVLCIKTTKEVGKDEIVLAAILTLGKIKDINGKRALEVAARKGQIFPAGKFKKGENVEYKPPKVIAEYSFGSKIQGWPQHYFATLLMIEKDEGNVDKIVDKAIDILDEQVTGISNDQVGEDITSMAGDVGRYAIAGGTIGNIIPIPGIGPALGAAIGALVGLGVGAIKNAQGDECFPPENIDKVIKSPPVEKGIVGEKAVAKFNAFKGEYKVVYSWYAS